MEWCWVGFSVRVEDRQGDFHPPSYSRPLVHYSGQSESKAAFSKGFGSHYGFVWLRKIQKLSAEEPIRELVSEK